MHPELKNTWTPAINVLTWFMLVTAILSVLTRLGTKYFFFRKFTIDDGFAAASMVLCIAQSIAVSLATSNGLGQHRDMLPDFMIESMMKVWMSYALAKAQPMLIWNEYRPNTPQRFCSSPVLPAPSSRS